MNNKRRQAIRQIINLLKSKDPDRESIADTLQDLLYDEEDVRDNYPESLQDTETYSVMEESCEYLEEAIDELNNMDDDDSDYDSVIDILGSIDGV